MPHAQSAVLPVSAPAPPAISGTYYRHSLPVRIAHWVNALCLAVLFMSGLGIFNAHPSLHWGNSSYTGHPAFIEITAVEQPHAGPAGIVRIAGHQIDTTGIFGLSARPDGRPEARAFPGWLTVPSYYSLAESRTWHFFLTKQKKNNNQNKQNNTKKNKQNTRDLA